MSSHCWFGLGQNHFNNIQHSTKGAQIVVHQSLCFHHRRSPECWPSINVDLARQSGYFLDKKMTLRRHKLALISHPPQGLRRMMMKNRKKWVPVPKFLFLVGRLLPDDPEFLNGCTLYHPMLCAQFGWFPTACFANSPLPVPPETHSGGKILVFVVFRWAPDNLTT